MFNYTNMIRIHDSRIIGLSKSNNSIFGRVQISENVATKVQSKVSESVNSMSSASSINSSSSVCSMGSSSSHMEESERSDSADFPYSHYFEESGDSEDSHCFEDSGESRDSGDSGDSCCEKYIKSYYAYGEKKYKLKNYRKKIPVDKRECYYYTGGSVTEFNKDSSFINMLINRRNRSCDYGPSCHIAAFVQDLGMENKFSDWAFGKLAIGENSERMRFGNIRLSTHAEMDALKKLDGLIRVKKCKKQKMDLVVIRINKSGNLCESAPCYHCTKELEKTKVVSINKLYFSRSDGTITCVKFSEWIKNENLHISKGWRRMNCVSK